MSSSSRRIPKPFPSLPLPSPPPTDPLPPHLLSYIRTHLLTHTPAGPTPLTPTRLLSFLRHRLHHHPSLSPYSLHVFLWAPLLSSPSFVHSHSTYLPMAHHLSSTAPLSLSLPLLLRHVIAHPCPCSSLSIFSCPHLLPIFRLSIQSLARAGRLDDAVAAFEMVVRVVDSHVDAGIYNLIIGGFGRRGEMGKAVEWYRRMVRDRVKPDVCTFNILISSCFRDGRYTSFVFDSIILNKHLNQFIHSGIGLMIMERVNVEY